MIAGISALAIWTLSVSGLVSAANTSTTTTSDTTTKSQGFKWGMKSMKRVNFWPGKWFGWEHGWKWMFWWMQNSAIKAAIDANDYNAFVTARNADTNKPSHATVPTQAQFTKMVEQSKKQTAVETALKNNDYDAFVKATTPSKEEFAQKVSEYKTRTATQAAIKANDYTAFTAAWNADTNKPTDAILPTQAEFTKIVEHFTAKSTTTSNQ